MMFRFKSGEKRKPSSSQKYRSKSTEYVIEEKRVGDDGGALDRHAEVDWEP